MIICQNCRAVLKDETARLMHFYLCNQPHKDSGMFNDSNFTGRTPRTLQESKFGPYAEMECYRCEGDDMAFSRPVWIIGTISALSVAGFFWWVLS